MATNEATVDVKQLVALALLKYDARHLVDCPQRQQNYWRLRPEYRPPEYGEDRPCTCGLDELMGHTDDRRQG